MTFSFPSTKLIDTSSVLQLLLAAFLILLVRYLLVVILIRLLHITSKKAIKAGELNYRNCPSNMTGTTI